ncbi:hypothetical protein EP30_08295 [Bifidobacterium sp. UTCIF-39]|uniref:RelA/SpoT domain-containing protein n=1 Tax=Bifidobacterium sp. UTCIF-39 TaxID=1465359 RepID=UPI001128CA24|nr:RelA/SpoT domain-containing protein [Bifidobacterium sp. UTCIF-39]TPF96305.1 hypothetical protein EP30_08295 [Bifidobacterium sp. UTCIF-39]
MSSDNVVPFISRSRANTAGKILRADQGQDGAEYVQAREIAQRWRAQHIDPTQQCFKQVLECSKRIPQSVATYRLKRMISIIRKLQRPNAHFKLGELDDIGGCRLIVETNEEVNEAADWLISRLSLKNGSGDKDYIAHPQRSGYRSRHLLCKAEAGSASYHVEVQIRTRLQHYWSTAVETVGEIYGTEYKSPTVSAAAQGADKERLIFFKIVSSLFALEEHTPQIPDFEGDQASLVRQLKELSCTDRLLADLEASVDSVFSADVPENTGELFLMKFSREDQYLDVDAFPMSELSEALRQYDGMECSMNDALGTGEYPAMDVVYDNIVLAYAHDAEQLAVAYPNYSTNVQHFLEKVDSYL